MADLTSFDLFCTENYPLMRQLKPFRFYDDAAQKKILESAWTKLGGKNKQYYVKKAEKRLINARYAALENMSKVKFAKDGKDDAFEIYRTEMRLILLQDPAFVKDHYHELQAVIKDGWNGLNGVQRLDFYERAVLATEDGYTEKAEEKQTPVMGGKIFGIYQKCFDRNYRFRLHSIGFYENRDTEWMSHSYKILMNPIDSAAFEQFANIVHAVEPSLVGKAIWKKWMDLNHEERESYYAKAFQTAASIDGDTLFALEKRTIVSYDYYSLKAYTENKELQNAWNDVSEEVRKVYIDRALNECLEQDRNPKTRFLGFYDYNKDKFMARATTIDDVNAELTPQLPFNFVDSDEVRDAFIVYMEKTRPELLKQPEMVQKRFWEINLVLWKQWYNMSEGEQQPYYDTVRRYLQIKSKLDGWKLEAWKVLGEDYKHRREFLALDAEAKKQCCEKALQNRKILLKKFPDLHDYYFWMTPELDRYEKAHVSTNTTTSSPNAVKNNSKTASEQPNSPYSPQYDFLMYTDVLDMTAFKQYLNDVQSMVSKYVTSKVWWRQFVNLSDEELNVYYDKAIKTVAAKQGRILFADEHCTVLKQSEKNKVFVHELQRLNEHWNTLSAPAKNYYVELAEQKLRKREKEKPEDLDFKHKAAYFCDIEVGNIPCNGHLVPKYSHVMLNFAKPEKNALTVYLKKHFTELYNEPGMADKRYFQLCLILEQRFMNLSDEERQIYLDIVQVINTINSEIRNLPITSWGVCYQKHKNLEHWQTANDKEKAVWQEEAKQNLKTLMEKFPALTEHFHWMVYRETSTESKATATNAETAATDEPTVTNETTEAAPEEVEISATWEVVNDDVNVQKEEETTLATDAEPTTAVHPEVVKQKDNSSKLLSDKPTVGGYTSKGTESLASWEVVKDEKSALEHESAKPADTEAVEVAIYKDESESAILAALDTASILKKQLGLLSSDSTSELEEPSLNANNAEESESAAWEVVDDETNVEDASSKPTDTDAVKPAVSENAPESSANSVQAKKTPTAFMFYKKAMRRLNADQNFGKKDNVSQRQALISDWKKLSDEDKAVYFEKELLARL